MTTEIVQAFGYIAVAIGIVAAVLLFDVLLRGIANWFAGEPAPYHPRVGSQLGRAGR